MLNNHQHQNFVGRNNTWLNLDQISWNSGWLLMLSESISVGNQKKILSWIGSIKFGDHMGYYILLTLPNHRTFTTNIVLCLCEHRVTYSCSMKLLKSRGKENLSCFTIYLSETFHCRYLVLIIFRIFIIPEVFLHTYWICLLVD